LAAAQKEAEVGSPLEQKGVSVWGDQLSLAKAAKNLPGTPPSADSNKLYDTYSRWAFGIALPVVKQTQDVAAAAEAVKFAQSVVSDLPGSAKTTDDRAIALKTAISLNAELLAALPKDAVYRTAALGSRWELHRQLAEWEYAHHHANGNDGANAQLSETQKQGLAVLAELIAEDATAAASMVQQLQTSLNLWIGGGQLQTAEAAYQAILPILPKPQQQTVQLAIVRLWLKQVDDEHARLTAAGLAIPRELNATHAKALVELCEMQAGLPRDGEAIGPIQATWKGIIDRYRTLEYFDIAEAAVKVAPEEANDNRDRLAELELAALKSHIARRELDRLIARHDGKKEISVTPAFKKAIDAYTQFIVDRPDHDQVASARKGVLDIAKVFEQHGAHLAAVEIYRDFAPIAAKTPKLTVVDEKNASVAQRVAYSVATTLDTHARHKLAKSEKDRKPGDPPPSEISAEFTAAIAAYRDYLKQHPKSLLVSDANRKILDIGLAYATIGGWQVADGIFESELERQVGLRSPERLKFARAMCLLGPAMPTHVREVLAARGTSDRDRPQSAAEASEQTAGAQPAPNPPPRQTATRQPQVQMPTGNLPANSSGSLELGLPAINAGTITAQTESQRIAREDAAIAQAIRQQLNRNANQVAMLQDSQMTFQVAVNDVSNNQVDQANDSEQGQQRGQAVASAPVLSDAEIARLGKAFDDTYTALTAIRTEYPDSSTADQARREILVMASHWRSLARWEEAAALAGRFLSDNPRDAELVQIRLQIARDLLAFATKRVKAQKSKQAMLGEVTERFANARTALGKIVTDFPDQKSYVQQAQWDIANSYLNRARVVSAFSSTLARGQYVQAARQLEQVADRYHDHPRIGQIPQMLWNIAEELTARGFHDEAIIVWTGVAVRYPTNSLAESALQRIAVAYRDQLDRPIKAAEIFQELNFATGGNNQAMQDAIYAIGLKLKNDQRWVESMHVLETFADTFPKHAQAGQALTMVGQIHQTNEAWEDAINAYNRVLTEFEEGEFAKTAKWAIAECTINLSQWQDAIDAYREYATLYPNDAQTATANARIEILKEVASYQDFINGDNKRKADDAQFQIARIVQERLNNSVKAIIEYRKVREKWPESHLADDALYKAGTLHLSLGNREKAREALMTVAEKYAASPLADDAFFLIGKSYEDESVKLATVTRAESLQEAKLLAQKQAYTFAQDNIRRNRDYNTAKVSQLKKAGKAMAAENDEARYAAQSGQYGRAQVLNFARQAFQTVEVLSAAQMADRQDKINAALRNAVDSYQSASRVAGADKADEALLRMAQIFDEKLKDSDAAVNTWLEIVAQFSGTSVAEDASWRIAQYYERTKKFDKAIEAYNAFLRNYRRSPKAGDAQAAIAENYEQLGEWIKAMDAYTSYLESFPEGPLAEKARTRINWIKTYIL
jgi:TolA-binding protein/tetratricopeptide (TPR) repeat protein